MEREELKTRIPSIKSSQDLLDLINLLKFEDYGEETRPFTLAQLSYFSNPNNPKRFKVFKIPKKHGGVREISAPVMVLRSIQYYLNLILSSIYEPQECVTGFIKGKNVVDNASMHVGQNYVLNIDLSNFFTSINETQVWKKLQKKPYNLSGNIAGIIAQLCSIRLDSKDGDIKYVLPQGAPTSPILANIICERLDNKLSQLASNFEIKYSRYADDMTFSCAHNVFYKGSEFVKSLHRIIKEENFIINTGKTRLQKKGQRQEVTGLNVNSKPNVPKEYVNWIRTTLHIWEKYGFKEAYTRFYLKYKEESGYKHKGQPDLISVLSGKLLYLKMVKGAQDGTYLKLQHRFDILTGTLPSLTPDNERVKVLIPYTLNSFEQKFSTTIEISLSEGKTPFGFLLFGKWQGLSIARDVNINIFKDYVQRIYRRNKRSRYYISLCSGFNNRVKRIDYFWLVTDKRPKLNKKDIAESTLQIKSEKIHFKNHTPLATVQALYRFSRDDMLKWFTHTPDTDAIDIPYLLNMTKKQLYDYFMTGDKHEILNKKTWNNIKSFVLHEEENPRPVNANGEVIPLAWGSKRLRKWCEQHPGKHPYYASFRNMSFYECVIQFRHFIEFRQDSFDMCFMMRIFDLITSLDKDDIFNIKFSERFLNLPVFRLFTDTHLVYEAIKKIFKWIYKERRISNEIFIDAENNEDSLELIIYHKKGKLALDENKIKGLEGDFEVLRLMLLSVADLRIEADLKKGKSYSIVCLDKGFQATEYNTNGKPHMKTPCSRTECAKIDGVKYYIKLYKNI